MLNIVQGFKTAGICAGIKKDTSKKDLMLIYSESPAVYAGVYTQNLAAAAPVLISKSHEKNATHRAIIVNSGNANACTGSEGLQSAMSTTQAVAQNLEISSEEVLVASTGIIGVQLPIEKLISSVPILVDQLKSSDNISAAEAIMTTDTFVKTASTTCDIDGKTITLSGFSKGSGMIHPNMATMLGFIMTDAQIDKSALHAALTEACTVSFNQVSVDGDTSTNDCAMVLANGMAQNSLISKDTSAYTIFTTALKDVCISLAKQIAQDGEGATKLLEAVVTGAKDDSTAQALSKAVISSSLVKSAFFGNDANWGRIVCALGYAGVPVNLDEAIVDLASSHGNICVYNGSGLVFDEDLALKILNTSTVQILIQLNDGPGTGTAWGCDLTYEYVKINGEYRS